MGNWNRYNIMSKYNIIAYIAEVNVKIVSK